MVSFDERISVGPSATLGAERREREGKEKDKKCKILNWKKSGNKLLARLDFSARKPPPACFYCWLFFGFFF